MGRPLLAVEMSWLLDGVNTNKTLEGLENDKWKEILSSIATYGFAMTKLKKY